MTFSKVSIQNLAAAMGIVGTLAGAATWAASAWGGFDRRLTLVETTTQELPQAQVENEARNVAAFNDLRKSLDEIDRRAHETSDDLRLGIRRIDDKLTALFIQHYDASSRSGPMAR